MQHDEQQQVQSRSFAGGSLRSSHPQPPPETGPDADGHGAGGVPGVGAADDPAFDSDGESALLIGDTDDTTARGPSGRVKRIDDAAAKSSAPESLSP